jgi:hypothetical protein
MRLYIEIKLLRVCDRGGRRDYNIVVNEAMIYIYVDTPLLEIADVDAVFLDFIAENPLNDLG